MIEHVALLKAAAGQIDALDADIRAINDDKKQVFGNVRETVAPELFKAWREAVKLRQRRSKGPDARGALEQHEERVWAVLQVLEAQSDRTEQKTAVDPVSGPANGTPGKTVPTRAHTHVAHDPSTGEISEPDRHDGPTAVPEAGGAGERLSHVVVTVPPDDYPDLPAALDRRVRVA